MDSDDLRKTEKDPRHEILSDFISADMTLGAYEQMFADNRESLIQYALEVNL